MIQEKYEYRNLPIPGGGYVTGFTFHPKKKDLLYIRTDIGGVYRFQREQQRWKSLIDHVTMDDLSETFPAAVALDPEHPERLYIACGIDAEPQGMMAVSEDCGESFVRYPMPMNVHGNKNGRGTGTIRRCSGLPRRRTVCGKVRTEARTGRKIQRSRMTI